MHRPADLAKCSLEGCDKKAIPGRRTCSNRCAKLAAKAGALKGAEHGGHYSPGKRTPPRIPPLTLHTDAPPADTHPELNLDLEDREASRELVLDPDDIPEMEGADDEDARAAKVDGRRKAMRPGLRELLDRRIGKQGPRVVAPAQEKAAEPDLVDLLDTPTFADVE